MKNIIVKAAKALSIFVTGMTLCALSKYVFGVHEVYISTPIIEEGIKYLMSSINLGWGLFLGGFECLGYVLGGTPWNMRIGGLLFHSITAAVYFRTKNVKDTVPFAVLHMINNFPCGVVRSMDFSLNTYVWISMHERLIMQYVYVWQTVQVLICLYLLWKKVIKK